MGSRSDREAAINISIDIKEFDSPSQSIHLMTIPYGSPSSVHMWPINFSLTVNKSAFPMPRPTKSGKVLNISFLNKII